ncbi:MAG: ATP-binding cassette domain-containing protein [Oscillospiraceae bacterium]|jgi:ATP-binding cassette subfamily B protein|nr:ATP-binding cassette domain-containing protein [Oscillospiraceae bacterium]
MKHKKRKDAAKAKRRGTLPKNVLNLLESQNLRTDDFIFSAVGDMDNDGNYCANWLAFDDKGLYIAFGTEETVKKKKRKFPEAAVKLTGLSALPLEDVEELKIERYVTTGRLIAVEKGEERPLTRFSIGKTGDIQKFADCFNAKINGKALASWLTVFDDTLYCPKCGERYPDSRKVCPNCVKKSSTIKRLFGFFNGFLPQMGLILLLQIIASCFGVILPKFSTEMLFDDVLNADNPDSSEAKLAALGVLVLMLIGIRVADLLFRLGFEWILTGVMPKMIYNIKVQIFTSMQRLTVGFYSSKQTGQLMDRVTGDANNIYWFFVDGAPFIVMNAVRMIGILLLMFLISWKLSLLTLLLLPPIVALAVFGDSIFRRLHHRIWAQNARMTSMLSDNINGQRVIKAFSRENAELERFSTISRNVRDAQLEQANKENTLFPLMTALVLILSTFVLVVGARFVIGGEITIGQLLTYTVYLTMIQGPIEFFMWVFNWWARAVDSAQRLFEIIDAKPDITEQDNPTILNPFRGDIEISELEFEYEPAVPIIKKISLRAEAGKMLGIVGKTGAGKSTIANLISRLYDPKAGVIRIDGTDIKELSFAQLRKNIGLVSQDIYLFTGTIADNIRYANIGASYSEVIAAAKAASAHDFILKLPDAYETRVGNGGQSLSGGEKQRISIARAVLQNPKILILDEATAAMDTATERSIQESLRQLKAGRTTIAIAHRLSTLRDADYLAVVDDGTLVEYGTFAGLIQQKGAFYKQYKIQSQSLAAVSIIGEESTVQADKTDE